MTPKEKLEELMDRMINTEHCGIKHFPNKNYCDCTEMNRFQSIQCVLIAIDEIITFGNQLGIREPMMFWKEIKQELEKL